MLPNCLILLCTGVPSEILLNVYHSYHSRNRVLYTGVRQHTPYTAETGFSLHQVVDNTIHDGNLIFNHEKKLPTPNQLRFFMVDGESSSEDLIHSLNITKQQMHINNRELLGGLMFTCCGRGPQKGFFTETDFDAKVFYNVFPDSPLLGCYVNGEIGPQMQVGISKESVLCSGINRTTIGTSTTSHTTAACNLSSMTSSTSATAVDRDSVVHGFTAIFCLFAAPPKKNLRQIMAALSSTSLAGSILCSNDTG